MPTNKKIFIGSKIGVFEILSFDHRDNKHEWYNTKCLICGREGIKRNDIILESVKFPTPSALCHHIVINKHGGYNDLPGFFLENEENKRIYFLWNSVLERTSLDFWEKYPRYTGTKMDPKWKVLSVFAKEIKEVEGYELWRDNKGKYFLDKDIKSPSRPATYSKDTCCFITPKQSADDVFNRHPTLREDVNPKRMLHVSISKGYRIKVYNKKDKKLLLFLSGLKADKFFGFHRQYVTGRLNKNNGKFEKDNNVFYLISPEEYEELKGKYPNSVVPTNYD